MIASAVPDPSHDMQHNDSAHATAVLVASRAEAAGFVQDSDRSSRSAT